MSGKVGDFVTNYMKEGPQSGALVAAEARRLKCKIEIGPPHRTPGRTVERLEKDGLAGMYQGEAT